MAYDPPIKLTDPAILPTGEGYGTAFSHDSTYLAVAHYEFPRITIYKRDGDTFTKLANPAILPTGSGNSTAFSHDSMYLAVAHLNSPRITIYKRDGDTFTKLANPATLPTSHGLGTAFSHDSMYLAVAHDYSPYITIYKRDGDTFTKLANPAILPTDTGYSTTFSHDSMYLAVAHYDFPYITIYKGGEAPFVFTLPERITQEVRSANPYLVFRFPRVYGMPGDPGTGPNLDFRVQVYADAEGTELISEWTNQDDPSLWGWSYDRGTGMPAWSWRVLDAAGLAPEVYRQDNGLPLGWDWDVLLRVKAFVGPNRQVWTRVSMRTQ